MPVPAVAGPAGGSSPTTSSTASGSASTTTASRSASATSPSSRTWTSSRAPVTTFAQLERRALALVADGRASVPLAVGQGARGSAVVLGPLFTGTRRLPLRPQRGRQPRPLQRRDRQPRPPQQRRSIDRWNDTGLLVGRHDGRRPHSGPSRPAGAVLDHRSLVGRCPGRARPSPSRSPTVPTIVDGLAPAPFLGIEGVMVTSYRRGARQPRSTRWPWCDGTSATRPSRRSSRRNGGGTGRGRGRPWGPSCGSSTKRDGWEWPCRTSRRRNWPGGRCPTPGGSPPAVPGAAPARAAFSAAQRDVLEAVG